MFGCQYSTSILPSSRALWWKCVFQADPASPAMKTEVATLGRWVCECFFQRAVQDCFVQVVSLYPAEIKSLFVPCRDKICQSLLWMCLVRCIREREAFIIWPHSPHCVQLYQAAHREPSPAGCVSVCVFAHLFVKVFSRGSLFLYHPLSGKSVPCWTISVLFDNVIAFAPHLPGEKKQVFCVQPVIYQMQQTVFM